jgi:hypothetical protein
MTASLFCSTAYAGLQSWSAFSLYERLAESPDRIFYVPFFAIAKKRNKNRPCFAKNAIRTK